MGATLLSRMNEWQEVLRNFKDAYGRCETNCYLPEQAVAEYIDCGRMSFDICYDTLWLLEHEPDYDVAYYYVVKDKTIACRQKTDRRQVVYLIGDKTKYRAEKRERELVLGGYQKYRKNLEYLICRDTIRELERADAKCDRFMKKLDVYYDWLRTEEEYNECYHLWSDRIDKYSVKRALPSTIRKIINNHECMLVKKSTGEIVAACQYTVGGNRGFSENIAVVEKSNGGGIGAGLLYHSFLHIINQGIDDTTYVWEENLESRCITERFGSLTGRFSQQLII